jgi:hypothetical protein
MIDLKKDYKKFGITAKKYMGDDMYSWAVFVKGRPVMTGLSRGEVDYYKRSVLTQLIIHEKNRR